MFYCALWAIMLFEKWINVNVREE